ncbi:MAG TPA: UrcA family protein [Gammaproteobacteria bacterium]|nr:UrcA family protein [Gammaproteobacteria bacterium]
MKTSIAMLVLLVGAGAGAPAMATISAQPAEQQQTHKIVVQYGDLNVNSAKGAEQLYSRISSAAHEVCGDVIAPLRLDTAYLRCRQTAMEDAVAKVGHPKLTALYDQHFPENPLVNNRRAHGQRSVG